MGLASTLLCSIWAEVFFLPNHSGWLSSTRHCRWTSLSFRYSTCAVSSIRNLIEIVRHELCSMPASTFSFFPAQNEHMGDRPFFSPLFPFLFEDYFYSGQIKSAQTLHYTIPMSTLLSAKWNRLQRRVDGVWGTIRARVRVLSELLVPCHTSDSDANFVVYHSSLPFR